MTICFYSNKLTASAGGIYRMYKRDDYHVWIFFQCSKQPDYFKRPTLHTIPCVIFLKLRLDISIIFHNQSPDETIYSLDQAVLQLRDLSYVMIVGQAFPLKEALTDSLWRQRQGLEELYNLLFSIFSLISMKWLWGANEGLIHGGTREKTSGNLFSF